MTNEIVLYKPNEQFQLEVQLKDETVWLTQQQMVALFNTTKSNVSMHIRNIYKEGELSADSTVQYFLTVQTEGNRQVTRNVQYYNLDVIISVGYRVKSQAGTLFRQWALKVLKEYLLRGYAVNQNLLYVEERIDRRLIALENTVADHQKKIDFFVRTSLPPREQVFFGGEFFEARVLLEKIIKSAKNRVIVVDAYVDAATFDMLDVRKKGVSASIYCGKDLSALRTLHNSSPDKEPIDTYVWSKPSHDRWLIIDDDLYHCGHSLKDMGQKLSAITIMGTAPDEILKQIQ